MIGTAQRTSPARTARWHPQRSGLRYAFVESIELVDVKFDKQIRGITSNLSRYGCHVRTSTAFIPGTRVKVTITHQGTIFQSEANVMYTLGKHSMGICFQNVPTAERAMIKQWLLDLSRKEFEQRTRGSTRIDSASNQNTFLVSCVVATAASIAGALAWFCVHKRLLRPKAQI